MRTLAAFVALQNCNFTPVFASWPLFRSKVLHLRFQNGNFTKVFDVRPSFYAKGSQLKFQNRNFATGFDVRPSFCAKRLRLIFQNVILHQFFDIFLWRCQIAILNKFLPLAFHFVRNGCISSFKLLNSHQFLTFDHCFAREGDDRPQKSRILPHVRASDMRNLCKGSRFHGHGRAALATQREDSEELDK